MNLLSYSLAAIVSYLGLFVGFILAIMAKEEVKPGEKFLILMQKIVLLLIFIFLLIFIDLNYLLVLLILLFIVIYSFKRKKHFNEIPHIYLVLAIIFYLSSKNLNLFTIESSLILLYGLPTGTLLTTKSKKESLLKMLRNIGFIILAIFLFILF